MHTAHTAHAVLRTARGSASRCAHGSAEDARIERARGSRPRRRLSKPLPYHSANPPGGRPRTMAGRSRPGRTAPIGTTESSWLLRCRLGAALLGARRTRTVGHRRAPLPACGVPAGCGCRGSGRVVPNSAPPRTSSIARRTNHCAGHGLSAPLDFGQHRKAVAVIRSAPPASIGQHCSPQPLSAAWHGGSAPSADARTRPSCRRSGRCPRTDRPAARSWRRRPDG